MSSMCPECGKEFDTQHGVLMHRNHEHSDSYPWTNEALMRKLYLEEGMSTLKIAEELGCSSRTAYRWVKKHGIPVQTRYIRYPELHDVAELKRRHHEEGLTLKEIAEEIGCSKSAVEKSFKDYDIELDRELIARRRREEQREGNPPLKMDAHGYEVFAVAFAGKTESVKHHRLLAVAEFGMDAVKDKVVHHKNEIAWDNRPENLAVMTDSEHKSLHGLDQPHETYRGPP